MRRWSGERREVLLETVHLIGQRDILILDPPRATRPASAEEVSEILREDLRGPVRARGVGRIDGLVLDPPQLQIIRPGIPASLRSETLLEDVAELVRGREGRLAAIDLAHAGG